MSNTTVSPYPFVLQRNFLSVVVAGDIHPMMRSQPMFKQMKMALERKQWNRIPELVSLAKQVAEKSHGKVKVTGEGVFYKGQPIHNVLTDKIVELLNHGRSVSHLLKFMDNLYTNPSPSAVNDVYQWISSGRFALTDDGCFLAYKKVRKEDGPLDYFDVYSGTVNNRVGERPMMPRSSVDSNSYNECSYGYHFCSRQYLIEFGSSWSGGESHIMEVKVNPADVVAIPIGYGRSKGRTWTYEVLREVQPGEMIEGLTDTAVMMQPVIMVAKERNALIKQVKALPTVKRLLRSGKMTPKSFTKASTGRLTGWLHKFTRMDVAPTQSKLFENPLRFVREAAGFTIGQVAKAADMPLTEVYNAERSMNPPQEVIDKVLAAIAKAQGSDAKDAGLSYPLPSRKRVRVVPTYRRTSYTSSVDDDDDVDDEDEEDDD